MPDLEVCANIGNNTGYCVTTLSEQERLVDPTEWIDFDQKALKMSPKSYADLKAVLLKLCKKSKDCDFETTVSQVEKLESKMASATLFSIEPLNE